MTDEQRTLDSPQPSPGSTRTKPCRLCGTGCTETWIAPEYHEYQLLGQTRRLTNEGTGIWKGELIDGTCPFCRETSRLKHETEMKRLVTERLKAETIAMLGGEHAYDQYRFEKYLPKTDSQAEALKVCAGFEPLTDNILLIGETGVGKSHLAGAIAAENFKLGIATQRWRVTQLLRFLRYERKGQEEERVIKGMVESPLLIIEDLGVQKETDWGTAVIWEIVDRRIDAGRNGLVVTTNLGRGKMAEQMGDRIPSRLSKICRILRLEGPDGRIAT